MGLLNQIAVVLNDLFPEAFGDVSSSPNEVGFQASIYRVGNHRWVAWLSNQRSANWLIVPLDVGGSTTPKDGIGEEPFPSGVSFQIDHDIELTQRFRDSLDQAKDPVVSSLGKRSSVLCIHGLGHVLAIHCESLQLVAALLHEFGSPPPVVRLDWQQALANPSQTDHLPSTAETLVTADGILIPLAPFLQTLRVSTDPSVGKFLESFSENETIEAPSWPWPSKPRRESTHAVSEWPEAISSKAVSANSARTIASRGSIRLRTVKQSKTWLVAVLVAVPTLLGILVFSMLNSNSADRKLSDSNHAKDAFSSPEPISLQTPSQTTQDRDASIASQETMPEGQERKTMDESASMKLNAMDQPEPDSIDSLLAQLQPSGAKPFNVTSTSAMGLIHETLGNSSRNNSADDANSISATETDPDDQDTDSDTNTGADKEQDASTTNADETIDVEKSIVMDAAVKTEVIPIGRRPSVKSSTCIVELKLDKTLVVEPTGPATIQGVSQQTWKIAIEDQDAELFLTLQSKPAARWQLKFAVMLRESPNAAPVPLAPRDAQNVGNRLIDYHQWLGNSIATLQNIKANARTRGRIDFFGEIKKLEKEQREVERAIDRWKAIARLSYLFFNENEIQLKLSN